MTIRSSETYENELIFSMKKQSSYRGLTKKYLILVDTYYFNTIHKISHIDENVLDKIEIRVYKRKSGKFLSGRAIYSDGRIVPCIDGKEAYRSDPNWHY